MPKSLKLFLILLVASTKTEDPEGMFIFIISLLFKLLLMRRCPIVDVICLGSSNRGEEGGGMIMGGSGIGGVQWSDCHSFDDNDNDRFDDVHYVEN